MNKALIVIDVQNGFVNKRTASLPAKIENLIRSNKYPLVVFSKFINRKQSNFFKLLNWKKMQKVPDTDIHSRLRKFANKKNTFTKTAYSVFKAKGFSNFLKKNSVTELHICGIDSDGCVLATAFEAFDLGYTVIVLSKFSGSHSGKAFDKSAFMILRKSIKAI